MTSHRGNDVAAGEVRAGGMGPRREVTAMLVAGVAGVVVTLLAAQQPWARATFTPPPPLPSASVSVTGHELAPAAAALGLAALACLAAILATRGAARRLCGALLAALGVLAAAHVLASAGRAHVAAVAVARAPAASGAPHLVMTPLPWWLAGAVGGLLAAAAGALAMWRGTGWPGMPGRYDRPGGPRRAADGGHGAAWDALDRGGDPTVPGS